VQSLLQVEPRLVRPYVGALVQQIFATFNVRHPPDIHTPKCSTANAP
jgi:hypothetical protein